MSQAFQCPKCGAPLDYHGTDPIIKCPYCRSSVIVPDNLRSRPTFSGTHDIFTLDGIGDMSDLLSQANQLKEVKEMAEQGEVQKAVELFRQVTGQDEFSARQAVNALVSGQPVILSDLNINGQEVKINAGSLNPTVKTVSQKQIKGIITAILIFVAITTLAGIIIPLIATFGTLFATSAMLKDQLATEVPQALIAKPTQAPKASPTPGYGTVDLQFGSKGIAPGMFDDARSIAVSPLSDDIFVADYQSGRVQSFTPLGRSFTQWIMETKDGMGTPIIQKLSVGTQSDVYVLIQGDIAHLDESGQWQNTISSFESFNDVVAGWDGKVYALEDDTLIVFDPQGTELARYEDLVRKVTGEYESNTRLAIDGQGNYYLLVMGHNQAVFKFNRDAVYVDRFGNSDQFHAPNNIAVDGQGRIFISDFDGVQVYSNDGAYIDTVGGEIEGVPFGITIDKEGRLLAIFNSGQVVRFNLK